MAVDLLAVNKGAIGTSDISNAPTIWIPTERTMQARQTRVRHADAVARVATECDFRGVKGEDLAGQDAADDDKLRRDRLLHGSSPLAGGTRLRPLVRPLKDTCDPSERA